MSKHEVFVSVSCRDVEADTAEQAGDVVENICREALLRWAADSSAAIDVTVEASQLQGLEVDEGLKKP
jgi:hypothetical protein